MYAGYSYWRNSNNHVGSDTMFVFLSLDREHGGQGPTLFAYDKVTDEVTVVGPLFDPESPPSSRSGEGWYFSATRPTTLYLDDGPALRRYDVLTRQFETVFDVTEHFGADRFVGQTHSSDDDRVHSATLGVDSTRELLGCVTYNEETSEYSFFAGTVDFDECQIDKSGRWLLIKEELDGLNKNDNLIVDLETGTQRSLLDEQGAGGHSDNGYGYMVAVDDFSDEPNAFRLWKFDDDPLQGSLVYRAGDWSVEAPGHVSHANARPGVPPEEQYVCGAGASRTSAPRSNEIVCFKLDESRRALVVAPVMTDLDAPGRWDDYGRSPRGNLDVTGRYFIWTSNMGGDRLDAFIVKVPSRPPRCPSRRPVPSIRIRERADGGRHRHGHRDRDRHRRRRCRRGRRSAPRGWDAGWLRSGHRPLQPRFRHDGNLERASCAFGRRP